MGGKGQRKNARGGAVRLRKTTSTYQESGKRDGGGLSTSEKGKRKELRPEKKAIRWIMREKKNEKKGALPIRCVLQNHLR